MGGVYHCQSSRIWELWEEFIIVRELWEEFIITADTQHDENLNPVSALIPGIAHLGFSILNCTCGCLQSPLHHSV